MYKYKLDASGNENAYIEIHFYEEETCEGYFGSGRGYGLAEGEIFADMNDTYIGIQVENHFGEPMTITLSITPKE